MGIVLWWKGAGVWIFLIWWKHHQQYTNIHITLRFFLHQVNWWALNATVCNIWQHTTNIESANSNLPKSILRKCQWELQSQKRTLHKTQTYPMPKYRAICSLEGYFISWSLCIIVTTRRKWFFCCDQMRWNKDCQVKMVPKVFDFSENDPKIEMMLFPHMINMKPYHVPFRVLDCDEREAQDLRPCFRRQVGRLIRSG